jgi:hypothetical protein
MTSTLGIPKNGHVLPPEVPGEDEALGRAVLFDVEHRDGAAEHMAGVEERERDPGRDGQLAMVWNGDHLLERAEHVVLVVQRLDAIHVALAAIDELVDEARVALLNVRRVGEHRRTQVAGRGRAEDRAVVAGFGEHG